MTATMPSTASAEQHGVAPAVAPPPPGLSLALGHRDSVARLALEASVEDSACSRSRRSHRARSSAADSSALARARRPTSWRSGARPPCRSPRRTPRCRCARRRSARCPVEIGVRRQPHRHLHLYARVRDRVVLDRTLRRAARSARSGGGRRRGGCRCRSASCPRPRRSRSSKVTRSPMRIGWVIASRMPAIPLASVWRAAKPTTRPSTAEEARMPLATLDSSSNFDAATRAPIRMIAGDHQPADERAAASRTGDSSPRATIAPTAPPRRDQIVHDPRDDEGDDHRDPGLHPVVGGGRGCVEMDIRHGD